MDFTGLTSQLRSKCPHLELRADEMMSQHTSFRIGGAVRLMALPKSEEEAVIAVKTAAEFGFAPLLIGNGSNLLVSDEGVDAFVIKSVDGLSHISVDGNKIVAGSGVSLSRLASAACEHGLAGLEFAHGIPGSLGGAVNMNAGAYGGEMAQVVLETRYLSADGKLETVTLEEHHFSYRHSMFSDGSRLILSSKLKLQAGDTADIRAKMKELMERRREKQPLEYPSAGSTFKRPEGHFAAALIDQCGLKGVSVGGAQVSEKHAGFIINRGGATCSDVLRLMDQVKELVFRQTGIVLEPEIKILGR